MGVSQNRETFRTEGYSDISGGCWTPLSRDALSSQRLFMVFCVELPNSLNLKILMQRPGTQSACTIVSTSPEPLTVIAIMTIRHHRVLLFGAHFDRYHVCYLRVWGLQRLVYEP